MEYTYEPKYTPLQWLSVVAPDPAETLGWFCKDRNAKFSPTGLFAVYLSKLLLRVAHGVHKWDMERLPPLVSEAFGIILPYLRNSVDVSVRFDGASRFFNKGKSLWGNTLVQVFLHPDDINVRVEAIEAILADFDRRRATQDNVLWILEGEDSAPAAAPTVFTYDPDWEEYSDDLLAIPEEAGLGCPVPDDQPERPLDIEDTCGPSAQEPVPAEKLISPFATALSVYEAPRVLDYGAGDCSRAAAIAEQFPDALVTAYEPAATSESALSDVSPLDIQTKFDVIVSNQVLHHVRSRRPAQWMRVFRHLLREGGVLVIREDITTGTEADCQRLDRKHGRYRDGMSKASFLTQARLFELAANAGLKYIPVAPPTSYPVFRAKKHGAMVYHFCVDDNVDLRTYYRLTKLLTARYKQLSSVIMDSAGVPDQYGKLYEKARELSVPVAVLADYQRHTGYGVSYYETPVEPVTRWIGGPDLTLASEDSPRGIRAAARIIMIGYVYSMRRDKQVTIAAIKCAIVQSSVRGAKPFTNEMAKRGLDFLVSRSVLEKHPQGVIAPGACYMVATAQLSPDYGFFN